MTDAMMRLTALPEKTSDADMLRKMIGFAAERLMVPEVVALTGTVPTMHPASGVATSPEALARARTDTAGSDWVLTLRPARSFEVTGFCGDPALAAAVPGWTAALDLKTGLRTCTRRSGCAALAPVRFRCPVRPGGAKAA
jgi:hypothetical protein